MPLKFGILALFLCASCANVLATPIHGVPDRAEAASIGLIDTQHDAKTDGLPKFVGEHSPSDVEVPNTKRMYVLDKVPDTKRMYVLDKVPDTKRMYVLDKVPNTIVEKRGRISAPVGGCKGGPTTPTTPSC